MCGVFFPQSTSHAPRVGPLGTAYPSGSLCVLLLSSLPKSLAAAATAFNGYIGLPWTMLWWTWIPLDSFLACVVMCTGYLVGHMFQEVGLDYLIFKETHSCMGTHWLPPSGFANLSGHYCYTANCHMSQNFFNKCLLKLREPMRNWNKKNFQPTLTCRTSLFSHQSNWAVLILCSE